MIDEDAPTLDRDPPADLDTHTPPLLHLRSGGVSLLLQLSTTALPVVRHWGADLGDLAGRTAPWTALDAVEPLFSLIPEPSDSWRADPALSGTREGEPTDWAVTRCQTRLFSETELTGGVAEVGADTVIVEAEDPVAQLSIDVAIQLTDTGVVCCRAGITNHGDQPYRLDGLSLYLPAGDSATHQIEFDGSPISTVPLRPGGLSCDSDSGELAQLLVGEPWAGFHRGQVWQAHVAFSGATSHRCVTAGGRSYLGGGERLAAGEVVLGPEESYHSPWVLWSWGLGLDAAAARLHRNARAGRRPARAVDLRCDRSGLRPARPAGHAVARRVRRGGRGGSVPARHRVVRPRRARPVRGPRRIGRHRDPRPFGRAAQPDRRVRPRGRPGHRTGTARAGLADRPRSPRLAARLAARRRARAGSRPVRPPGDGPRVGAADQAAEPAPGLVAAGGRR